MSQIENIPLPHQVIERRLVLSGLMGPIVLAADELAKLQIHNIQIVDHLLEASPELASSQEATIIKLDDYRRADNEGTQKPSRVKQAPKLPILGELEDKETMTPLDEVTEELTPLVTVEGLFDDPEVVQLEEPLPEPVSTTKIKETKSALAQIDDLDQEIAGQDTMSLLMKDVGKYPLLTAPEEVYLAKRIETGDAAAKERMVVCNLRLVVKVATRYLGLGVSLPDLVQVGVIGLNRAAEKFDWRKGNKFSTYAMWWIRQAMQRAVADDGETIRVPVHVVERQQKLRRANNVLTAKFSRAPTPEELASATGLPINHVKEALGAAVARASLNQKVGADEEGELGDLFADPEAEDPIEEADRSLRQAEMRRVLEGIPAKERQILELRFGFNGPTQSLEEIGRKLGYTRERIRQMEEAALEKLATLPEVQALREN